MSREAVNVRIRGRAETTLEAQVRMRRHFWKIIYIRSICKRHYVRKYKDCFDFSIKTNCHLYLITWCHQEWER